MARKKPALWRRPRCGERFTTRNQGHSCAVIQLNVKTRRCKVLAFSNETLRQQKNYNLPESERKGR